MKAGKTTRMTFQVLMTIIIFIGASPLHAAGEKTDSIKSNCYLKFNLSIKKRNFLLLAVPNLYSIASGSREYLGESYGKSTFYADGRYRFDERLHTGNISEGNSVFPRMFPFVVPTPYKEELFKGLVISPFNAKNLRLYRYTVDAEGDSIRISFRPRIRNCQLTSGTALVDKRSEKIVRADFNGEFDHIIYNLKVSMDTLKDVPEDCQLNAAFKLCWNNIQARIHARFDDSSALPDSIPKDDRNRLMSTVRMDSLTDEEKDVYVERTDTTHIVRKQKFYDRAWSAIDEYLVSSLRVGGSNSYFSFSPIIDLGGLSYSTSSGISYRFNLNGVLKLSSSKFLSTRPYIGYNFKLDEWLFRIPVRFTYNKRRNDFIELFYAQGSKISDSRILDMLKNEQRSDTIDFENLGLHYFHDNQWSINLNQSVGKYFQINYANIYHVRNAENRDKLIKLDEPYQYKSFAASLALKYKPSHYAAYTLSYERGFDGVLGSDMIYGRIEADAQMEKKFGALTSLNVRFGAGGYMQSSTIFFVDYVNFAQNYLPETWDEWKGTFFLLSSNLYNASQYYVRTNISYESPIMAVAHIPLLGYFVEKECVYLNALQLQHTPTYFELGYGFTTRFASFGVFAGTFGSHFSEIGTKITFDLFKRW